MRIDDIKKRNEEIEKRAKISQEVFELHNMKNVEKLKYFDLISDKRIREIKKICLKDLELLAWEDQITYLEEIEIETWKIAGTWHPNYRNMSLFSALNNLKKFDGVLSEYLTNPSYYASNESRTNDDKKLHLIYRESEDKYYINGHANNRLITVLAMGLKSVRVNSIEVYSENIQLKRIIEWMKENGFTFEESKKDNSVIINSDFLVITLRNDSLDKLDDFIEKYEKLNVSNIEIGLYKLRGLFIHNFKNKFMYADELTHLFHKNYLEIREHKLNYS